MGTISGLNSPLYYLYDLCTCSDLFRLVCILILFYVEKTSSRNFSPKTSDKFMGSTIVLYFSEKKPKAVDLVYGKSVNQLLIGVFCDMYIKLYKK